MPDDAAARALDIANELSGVVSDLAAKLGNIAAARRRDRHILRVLAVTLALDVALSVAFVFLYAGQAQVSQQIHASQLHACAIGNQFRHGQVALWEHVISVAQVPKGETAAERKARLAKLAAFRAYVRAQFKPVNCKLLYRR